VFVLITNHSIQSDVKLYNFIKLYLLHVFCAIFQIMCNCVCINLILYVKLQVYYIFLYIGASAETNSSHLIRHVYLMASDLCQCDCCSCSMPSSRQERSNHSPSPSSHPNFTTVVRCGDVICRVKALVLIFSLVIGIR